MGIDHPVEKRRCLSIWHLLSAPLVLLLKPCCFPGRGDRPRLPTGPTSEGPTPRGRRQPRQTGTFCVQSSGFLQDPTLDLISKLLRVQMLVAVSWFWSFLFKREHLLISIRRQQVAFAALQTFGHLLEKLAELTSGLRNKLSTWASRSTRLYRGSPFKRPALLLIPQLICKTIGFSPGILITLFTRSSFREGFRALA